MFLVSIMYTIVYCFQEIFIGTITAENLIDLTVKFESGCIACLDGAVSNP